MAKFREPAVSFVDIGGNRERSSVNRIDQKSIAAWKLFGELTSSVGEVDGLLVDQQPFKRKRHGREWKGEETAGEQRMWMGAKCEGLPLSTCIEISWRGHSRVR